MSTKVYDAFKVDPLLDIWDVAREIKDRGQENVVDLLKKHITEEVRCMNTESPIYKKKRKASTREDELSFRLWDVCRTVQEEYKKASTSVNRGTYNLDVGLAVYRHKSGYYLRTFCDHSSAVGGALDFVESMPGVSDFHYQNSSDRPDEVSQKDWKNRAKVWDDIFGKSGIGYPMMVDICCWSNYYRLDPWLDLAKEWVENPLVLPSREQVWVETYQKMKVLEGVTFEYSPGRVTFSTGIFIRKKGRKFEASTTEGVKEFKTFGAAADQVYFDHLPESTRAWITRLREQCSTV